MEQLGSFGSSFMKGSWFQYGKFYWKDSFINLRSSATCIQSSETWISSPEIVLSNLPALYTVH